MRILTFSAFGLLLAGCGMTSAQMDTLTAMSKAARARCVSPGACPAQQRCIVTVVAAFIANTPAAYRAAVATCPSMP